MCIYSKPSCLISVYMSPARNVSDWILKTTVISSKVYFILLKPGYTSWLSHLMRIYCDSVSFSINCSKIFIVLPCLHLFSQPLMLLCLILKKTDRLLKKLNFYLVCILLVLMISSFLQMLLHPQLQLLQSSSWT